MIDKELEKEIREYCKMNDMKYTQFVNEMLRKQFSIEKYGDIPFGEIATDNFKKENVVQKKTINIIVEKPIVNSTENEKNIINSSKIEPNIESKKSNHKIKIIRK